MPVTPVLHRGTRTCSTWRLLGIVVGLKLRAYIDDGESKVTNLLKAIRTAPLNQRISYSLSALVSMVLLLTASCSLPRQDSIQAVLQTPESYSDPGGDTTAESRWWEAFDDAALNAHMERALNQNFTLLAAWERLRAARALAAGDRAALRPTLEGDADAGFKDDSEEGTTREFSLGLEATYELDLWGKLRSRAEAEALRGEAAMAAYRTAALSLSAELAQTWVQVAEAREQQRLAEDQIATNQKVLDLLEARFAAGLISSADVLRQRQLLEATREQALIIKARTALGAHQLAILQGAPPRAMLNLTEAALPNLPPLPSTGLPAELIQRRPDVREAYLRVQAADRDLAAAISERYPRIDLTAAIETSAESPADLFNAWIFSLAEEMVAPLLTGGALSADIDRHEAERNELLAEYRHTVLTAFKDVEDALVSERQQQARLASLHKQLGLARQTLQQLRVQYINGVTDYLAVLAALTDSQRLQRDVLATRRALIEFRIALYRALAGDIETERERPNAPPAEEGPDHG